VPVVSQADADSRSIFNGLLIAFVRGLSCRFGEGHDGHLAHDISEASAPAGRYLPREVTAFEIEVFFQF